MKTISRTSRFKRDVKKMKKRGKSFEVFRQVILELAEGNSLDPRYRDHKLIGNYKGTRECHIESDWLLIYKVQKKGTTTCPDRYPLGPI